MAVSLNIEKSKKKNSNNKHITKQLYLIKCLGKTLTRSIIFENPTITQLPVLFVSLYYRKIACYNDCYLSNVLDK